MKGNKYNRIINSRFLILNSKLIALMLCLPFLFASCEEDESKPEFDNKCIKRSLGPNVKGVEMEFAYAMAIQPTKGKLVSAQVEATIAGAAGTWLEHHSYHTKLDGIDSAVVVGNPCVTDGNRTTVEFIVDTCAATLRYYYVPSEEAKGKEVSFTFSTTASTGETIIKKMGPYKIAEMDMQLDLTLTSANCYISIEDMAVYDATTAATMPEKIDLVYLFRNYDTIAFNHSFVAPAADASKYLPGITLPAGVNRNTKIRDVGIKDAHLARLHLKAKPEAQPAIYIDDIDFKEMDMGNMPNWALDIITNDGMWIETQDGKYRAYIFANEMRTARSGGTISMKRYKIN